jgi:hypothetical protein
MTKQPPLDTDTFFRPHRRGNPDLPNLGLSRPSKKTYVVVKVHRCRITPLGRNNFR